MTRRRRGVSLIEVMVVIAILLVLITVIGVGAITTGQWAKVDITKIAMADTAQDVDLHAFRHGTPSTSEGLRAVYGDERIPADGWQRELLYAAPGPSTSYELSSLGADGVEGGDSWNADLRWSEIR